MLRKFGDQCLELLMPGGSELLHAGQQIFLFHDIEHRQSRGARQRRSAKRGAVRSGLKKFGRRLAYPNRANGKTSAETFGHADRIGPHIGVFKGEERSRAPDPTLHLIEHQQQIVFRAQRPQAPEKFGSRRIDTALALHRLEEDRRGVFVDQIGEALEIVEFPERETVQQRSKPLLDLLLGRSAHAAKRAPVKSIFRADDFEALALYSARFTNAMQSRELEQTIIRLGSTVAKKQPTRPRPGHQPPGKFTLQRVAEKIARMNQLAGLALHGLHPFRMAVPKHAHRNS